MAAKKIRVRLSFRNKDMAIILWRVYHIQAMEEIESEKKENVCFLENHDFLDFTRLKKNMHSLDIMKPFVGF